MVVHRLFFQLSKYVISLHLKFSDGFVLPIDYVLFLIILKFCVIKLSLSRIHNMHNVHILKILLVYFIFVFRQFQTQLLISGHSSFTVIRCFSDLILRILSLPIFLFNRFANLIVIGSLQV